MIFRPLHGCEGTMSNRGRSKVLYISLNILFSLKSVTEKALLNTPCFVKERENFTTVIIIECNQKLINPLWVSDVVFLFSKCTMKLANQNIKLQFSCTEVLCISHLAWMRIIWSTQYIFNFPMTILKGQQIHDYRESRTSTVPHMFYPWCTMFLWCD